MYVADNTSGESFPDGLDDSSACAESVADHCGVAAWLAAMRGQRFQEAIRAVTTSCRTMSPSPRHGSGLCGESSLPHPRVNTVVDQHFGPAWRCEIQIDFVPIVALNADNGALRDNQAGSLLADQALIRERA